MILWTTQRNTHFPKNSILIIYMGEKAIRQFSGYLSWQYQFPKKKGENHRFYNFINWKFLLQKKKKNQKIFGVKLPCLGHARCDSNEASSAALDSFQSLFSDCMIWTSKWQWIIRTEVLNSNAKNYPNKPKLVNSIKCKMLARVPTQSIPLPQSNIIRA